MTPARNTPADFWKRVDKTPTCWLWTGARQRNGYGRFRFEGRTWLTHVWVWVRTHGPLPDGMVVEHLDGCDRACVRLEHLHLARDVRNIRRGHSKRGQKTCLRGHEMTEANTYIKPNGTRQCRACTTLARRERSRLDTA